MTYEYQTISALNVDTFMKMVNDVGGEGWRMVGSGWEDTGFAWAFMERLSQKSNDPLDLPERDYDDCPF